MPAVASERDLEELVEAVRSDPERRDELVPLLREDAAVHRDRSMATTARLKGWVLAAFADVGLPDEALPFVLEELSTGREPHLVAAAARATRGAPHPDAAVARALVDALGRILDCDDAVTFEALQPDWPASQPTTAAGELIAALRAMGPTAVAARDDLEALLVRRAGDGNTNVRRAVVALLGKLASQPAPVAHCCASHEAPEPAPGPGVAGGDVEHSLFVDRSFELEDQDGNRLTMRELLSEPVTVVAFFYTRCPNPEKCSATITRLAEVQSLVGPGVGLAAVTYDPGFDTAPRLRAYGAARGIRFGPAARLLRCPEQHDALAESIGLLVGYNGSVVNRHAVELYLVATDGQVIHTWTRVRWDPEEVARVAAHFTSALRAMGRSMPPTTTPSRWVAGSLRERGGAIAT